MEEKQKEKFRKLTQDPVGRLICEMAVPCIISMLVTAFYNMADTFFVGKINSNSATGAVGVVFSMMAVIQAVGFFFGHGSGNFISRELGEQKTDTASEMASTGFFLALLAGGVIMALGLIFLAPLASVLGSTPTILPYAKSYLGLILIGAPYMTASLVLNNQLRFQGSAFYGMVGISAGAVLNIGLDPLLIFVFHMGIAGAALATIISQFVSFCLLLVGCTKGGNLKISLKLVRFQSRYFVEIVRGGLPSLARQGLASLAAIFLNRAAGLYGDAAIAAMAIVSRVMMFGGSALIGFGQGFQPVCGFNYGAKLWDRVKQGFWFCVKSSSVFLLALSVLGIVFAPQIIAFFRDDPDVIRYGTTALRLQCATFALSGWVVMSNMMMQNINATASATFLAMARQGIFFVPALWIMTPLLGMLGIQLAQPVADLLSFSCAVPLQVRVLRRLTVGGTEASGKSDG